VAWQCYIANCYIRILYFILLYFTDGSSNGEATRLKEERGGCLESVSLEYEERRGVADEAEHDQKSDE